MKKQFLIIGLGTFGMNLAKELSKLGAQVLVIDKDKEKIEEASEFATQAVEGDATDKKLLASLNVGDCDVGVVAISGSFDTSVSATLLLKELGVKSVLVKTIDDLHAKIVTQIGADGIISPEKETAKRLAEQLTSPWILDKIKLSDEYNLIEVSVPKKFVGKSLKQLNLRQQYHINVVAIKRKIPILKDNGETDFREEVDMLPGAETELSEGDVLYLIGKDQSIDKLKKDMGIT